MSKCQACKHYGYKAGVAPRLQKMIGIIAPTSPTNYCAYAGISWQRKSAEVRKPKGIRCNFEIAKMECKDCGKTLKSASDLWLKLTKESYICQKCGKQKNEK